MIWEAKLNDAGWWDLTQDDQPVHADDARGALRLFGDRVDSGTQPGLSAWEVCWWIIYESFDQRMAGLLAERMARVLVIRSAMQISVGTPWVNAWVHAEVKGGA